MNPENEQKPCADCDRCGNRFEIESIPAACPKCGATVSLRPPAEAKPVDPVAERFRLAARRAKGIF